MSLELWTLASRLGPGHFPACPKDNARMFPVTRHPRPGQLSNLASLRALSCSLSSQGSLAQHSLCLPTRTARPFPCPVGWGSFLCGRQLGTILRGINRSPGLGGAGAGMGGWAALGGEGHLYCSPSHLVVSPPAAHPLQEAAWLFYMGSSPWHRPGRGQAPRGFGPPAILPWA